MSNKYLGTESGLIGPVPENVIESKPDFRDYDQGGQYHNAYVTWFNKYLSSFTPIPCEGWKPEEGREYTEGVHFVKQHQYYNGNAWCNCGLEFFLSFNLYKNHSFGRIVAVPLTPAGDAPPQWYTKSEMYSFLISKDYSKEIAEELSEMWANHLQGAFKKGWEKATNDGKLTDSREYKYMPAGDGGEKEYATTIDDIDPRVIYNYLIKNGEIEYAEHFNIICDKAYQQSPTYPAEFVEWCVKYAVYQGGGMWKFGHRLYETTAELYAGPYQEYLKSQSK